MADTKAAPPAYKLVVKHTFGNYKRGQRITDAVEIQKILDGEHAIYVLKILA
nr:hypothetical protein [Chromobacterium sp. ASV5]